MGDCFTLKLLGYDLTFMIGPDAQAAFFRASDEELSAREAYKYAINIPHSYSFKQHFPYLPILALFLFCLVL